jgi:hypothetical protein
MRPAIIFFLTAALLLPCEWDYPIWSIRDRSADPLYRFVRDSKAGYIDNTGKVVIPPSFTVSGNYGSEFHDGRLEVTGVSGGKYVDRSGKPVANQNLYRGWDFSDGLAVAMRKGEDAWGFIDPSGEFAIAPRFPSFLKGQVYPFQSGFAAIRIGDKVGYINHTGEFVVQPRFLDGEGFHDGLARVVIEGPCVLFREGPCPSWSAVPESARGKRDVPLCKFAYTDASGRIITEQRFDAARDFSEGLAPVRVDKFWGYIDKSGKSIILPRFDDAQPFSEGLARVREHDRWGYIDKSGVYVIRPAFEYAEEFHEGLAVVGNQTDGEDEYWYIGKNGEQALRLHFGAAGAFFHGLAHVRLLADEDDLDERSTFAYIDTGGRVVFSYTP